MLKRMTAKFNGKCAISGAPIYIGDDITYDTVSRKAYLLEHDDAAPMPANDNPLPERKQHATH